MADARPRKAASKKAAKAPKRAAPKASKKAAAKAPVRKAAARKVAKPVAPPPAPAPSPATAAPAAPPPAAPDWIPVPAPAPAWQPVTTPAPAAPAPAAPAFDLATGDWLPAAAPPMAAPAVDPAAYRKGATRSILLNVLLGIDLALLAFNFLAGLVIGAILVFAPDSDAAEAFAGAGIDSPAALALLTILMFILVGVIPFLWVLGTRVVPWEGTKRYLALRGRPLDIVRGILLVPVMIIAVIALSTAYVCVVDGCDALDDEPEPSGVDDILDNLTWTVAILVALGAGIGEEILFRGVLQRWLGVWGQGIAFGLAHAANGFPPQVLFAFALGVAFGYLFKRGWSLWSLIIAHTLYDFTILAIAILYPELG